jgi:hypothetical protein
MAVYDDLRGWDTLPYIGAEFYLEYGKFNYYITASSAMLIAGSGELVNPKDVLTKTQIDRLAQARNSDKTVFIRTAAEVSDLASRPKYGGTLTWHFHMDHRLAAGDHRGEVYRRDERGSRAAVETWLSKGAMPGKLRTGKDRGRHD